LSWPESNLLSARAAGCFHLELFSRWRLRGDSDYND
jgi:hypothetical protein